MSLTPEQTLQKTINSINKAFEQVGSPKSTKGIAIRIRDLIVKRTRLGKVLSSSTGGKLVANPKLSDSYKKQRAGEIAFFTNKKSKKVYPVKKKFKTNLSNDTTPAKSNITATGELLKSFGTIGNKNQAVVNIGKEKRNKGLLAGYKYKQPTNSRVIGFLREQGRDFFGLSKSELNIIRREVGNKIKEIAAKLMKS